MTFLDWHLKGVPHDKIFLQTEKEDADEQDDNDNPC